MVVRSGENRFEGGKGTGGGGPSDGFRVGIKGRIGSGRGGSIGGGEERSTSSGVSRSSGKEWNGLSVNPW